MLAGVLSNRGLECGSGARNVGYCDSITGAVAPRGIGDSGGGAPATGTVAPGSAEGPGGGSLATDAVALEYGITFP